jgi:hypothetical protein
VHSWRQNGSAKVKLAPRRILIFLARRMLRRNGVSFWLAQTN